MINYVIKKKKNPVDKTAPEKFYVNNKTLGTVGREEFLDGMLLHTSLTTDEANSAFNYFLEALPRYLSMGFNVSLGKLGYFRLSIRSTGSEIETDADANKIKSVKVRFVSGTLLRDKINSAKLAKFDPGAAYVLASDVNNGNAPAGA